MLTASAGSAKLQPTKEQIIKKGGTNEQLKELGIADNIEGLTRSEAREILVLANAGRNQGSARRRKESEGNRDANKERNGEIRFSIQNNSGEYETKDGEKLGFTS